MVLLPNMIITVRDFLLHSYAAEFWQARVLKRQRIIPESLANSAIDHIVGFVYFIYINHNLFFLSDVSKQICYLTVK